MHHSPINIPLWHEQPDARAMLAEIASVPPRYVTAPLPHILTGQPVKQYDRDDIRVAKLEAFASGWFAATGSFDLTVDEVIAKARAAYRLKEAELDRVAALLNDGYCLADARRMADLPDAGLLA